MIGAANMKNFVVLILLAMTTLEAKATTVEAPYDANIEVADIDERNDYNISFIRTLNVSKILSFSALASPIQLIIKCDDKVVAESAPIKFLSNMLKKDITLEASFVYSKELCSKPTFKTILSAVGLDSVSPNISYHSQSLGESLQSFLDRVKDERPAKSKTLVQISAKLASFAGAKASMYCLIEKHSLDDLMTGIVAEITTEYEKIFGPFKTGDFSCPTAAAGLLDSSIVACTNDPDNLSQFCLVYDKYKSTMAWYSDILSQIVVKKSEIANTTSDIYQAVTELETSIKSDEVYTRAIVN